MKRRLLAIAMTLAMALSLLPVTALADGTEDQTPSSVTVTDEPDQTDPTNGTSDEETATPTDEEPATDTETPVEDPEQGTEPTNEVGSGDAATVAAITTQDALEEAIKVAPEGGTVTLDSNIDITEPIVITKELTLDLNGKTIAPTAGTTIWKDDIKHWSLIRVAEEGNLTVTGEGTLRAAEDDSYAIDLYDETSKCTIENGTFVGNVHAVYVFAGELTVNGGTFSVLQKYSEEYPDEYVLNCYDAHYKDGTASITVSGGTFVGFNPSNCRAEGAGTDFCAPGYIVEEKTTGGKTSYTVTKLSEENSVAQVDDEYYATLAKAVAAAKDGDTIELLDDATGDAVTFAKSGTYVLDLNGHTYTCTNDYDVIMVKSSGVDLTIQNGKLIGKGTNTYGVYVYSIKNVGPCDNVTVTLDQVGLEVTDQALGVNGTNNNNNLIVRNSTVSSTTTAIYFTPISGKLTIENSTVTGVNNAIVIKGGEVEISGDSTVIHATGEPKSIDKPYGGDPNDPGSFPVSGSAVYVEGGYKASDGSSPRPIQVNIQGGTFKSDQSAALWGNFLDKDAQTIQVTGGTYISSTSIEDGKDDVNPYCPTGYVATEEPAGTWTVGPKTDGMEASVDTPVGDDGNKIANADVGGSFNVGQSGEDGVSTDNTTIQIDVTTGTKGEGSTDPAPAEGVTTTNVTIAPESLTSVQKAETITSVEIATDVGTLTVSKAAWNTITTKAASVGENVPVTLSISQVQTAEGNKPLAYELTAKADGEDVFAQGGDNGTITVNVPYTANDSTVYVYYVGDDGAEQMTTAKVESGRLTWDVTHFSTYVVTQNENSKAFTVTEDDDTVTEYTDLKAVLDAIASNTINDEVVINLVQGSTHTVDNANYDIDQNVTINGANATIEVNVSTEGSEGSHHAFQIVGDHTLTLNGVTMNITETGTGTVGTYGIDVQYGSTLVLDNADLTISNVSNATISAGSGTNPGQFKILNGSTVTATDIGGNFSNGGVWTIQNSELDINGCASHGLSADAVTVDNSIVTITNAAYRGISVNGTHGVDGNLLIMNGSTVSVENCATQALGETTFDAVRVATATGSSGKGKLQVDSTSSLTLTGENKEIEFAGFEGSENPEIDIQGKVEGATITGIVAEHNGVGYATLDAALTAAGNNTTDKTVTLLGDVETSTAISIPEDVTLDGNGHSITATAEIANGGLLNITQDQVTVKNLTINTNGNVKYGVQFFATEGGTLDNVVINGGKYASVIVNGATGVTIKNSELNPETDKNAYANIEYALTDSSKTNGGIPSLTVDNVTFTSGIYQIWADETTTKLVGEKMVGSPTNTQIRDEINGSITNLNSDDITVTMRLPNESSNTSSSVDGTDDDDNGGGSHGGGSSVTRYTVSVPSDIEGGSVRVSPTRASRGQTVTITVDPDDGYELDRLVVRDADGDRIDLERKSDTKYTFEMPRGKVTVEATFTEIEEEDAIPFRDVDTDDWFYDAVVYAYDTGLMSGVSDDQFAPDATLTRAMVAQMLYSLEGKPRTGSAGYAHVAFGAWYEDAVAWISSEGLMTGYSDTAFGPDDPLTREQLALILYNYADWAGYDVRGGVSLGSYIDADSASAWSVEALEWAIDAGLISGRGDGILAPAGTATRAEVAQIFMNFLENVAQ